MGEHDISTTEWGTKQPLQRTESGRSTTFRRSVPSVVSTGIVPGSVLAGFLLAGFVAALFAASVAAAVPAAAVDDPSRPDARVTHGPSCRPGGLVVEITAGNAPYSVRLATTRRPAGEDEALLEAGGSVVLYSDDVAYGETIDGRLEYAAQDGSGATYVDELEDYSFTRPSKEDCDAIAAPASPEPVSPAPYRPTTSAPAPAPTSTGAGAAQPAPPVPTSSGGRTATPAAESGQDRTAPPSTREPTGSASTVRVPAGGTVTLVGSGFLPGENVTVRLHGDGSVLGTAVAGADGTVRTEVRIPSDTASGTAQVDLVGDSSAIISGVALQVAAQARPAAVRGTLSLWALVAAAVALVGAVGALVSVAGRQRTAGRRGSPSSGA
ncbi:MAG: uncharacterized protein JWQ99_662 [Blastococcus sp.]|nr:uncharacterized protein [Blastococcus sp.]